MTLGRVDLLQLCPELFVFCAFSGKGSAMLCYPFSKVEFLLDICNCYILSVTPEHRMRNGNYTKMLGNFVT